MRKLLLLIAMLAGCASAPAESQWQRVFRADDLDAQPMALRIFDAECTDAAVLKGLKDRKVKDEIIAKFKRAVLTWKGREWASCWVRWKEEVISIDEDAEFLQPIPWEAFRDESI